MLQLWKGEGFGESPDRSGDFVVHAREECQAGLRDGRDGAATIGRRPRPLGEPLPDQSIEHAGDVGRTMDAAFRHLTARKARGMGVAEDPEHPVLVGRDAMALADLCQRFLQIVGRLHHGERRAFRHTDVSLLFHSLANGHTGKSVPNTLCQACESSWEHFHVPNTFCVYPEEPGAASNR